MVERVVVRIPATVANLGPGFDCLGLALDWHNELRIERAETLSVTASGAGADRLPRDQTSLVVQAAERILGPTPSIAINQTIGVPVGRGLGSSAGAICGGLVAARALAGSAHTDADLLAIAIEMEGHADNVAPCLLGGVTASMAGRSVRLEPPAIDLIIAVSPTGLPTHTARAALRDMVTHADAVATIGAAATLAVALAMGDVAALFDATADVFHQPARAELMPDSAALLSAMRGAGIAAFLSGAGPSVGAFLAPGQDAPAMALIPDAWDRRVVAIDPKGVMVVDSR